MNWVKRLIRQDVLAFLFLCFLLGAGFIWLGAAYGWLQISDGDKISSTVLWLTSLAIFWYAYETYQLKKSSTDQALIQETIMQNEFLPILEPVNNNQTATLRGANFQHFQVRNLGRGPAKYIDLHVGSVTAGMDWSLAGGERTVIKLPAEARAEVRQLLAAAPAKVRVRLTYQDIYKRKFQTEHIIFDRSPRGSSYTMRQGSWDFKRVRT